MRKPTVEPIEDTATRQSWEAMKKFCDETLVSLVPMSDQELDALSWLTLIDKRGDFEPGNVRWARTATERRLNHEFYVALIEDRMKRGD